MIENFPINPDKDGRIVIPKRIRNELKIDEGTKLNIRQSHDYLYFDLIKEELLVDSFGRILIPKNQREKYNITSSNTIVLSSTSNGFKIKNNTNNYYDLINKLIYLEKNHNFSLILTNEKELLYKSKKYSTLNIYNLLELKNYFSNTDTLYKLFNYKDNLYLFIEYNSENESLLEIIQNLL